MTESHSREPGVGPKGPGPVLAEIIDDWVTIWQSELAGLVLDREMQDAMLRAVDGWATQSRAMARMMAPYLEGVGDGVPAAGPHAAPRAEAPVAAPDGRDTIIRDLLERVAELERRIAAGVPSPP